MSKWPLQAEWWTNTVRCHYNTVQYNMILHEPLQVGGRISIRVTTHKRQPITHPNRWVMECFCYYFGEIWPNHSGTTLYVFCVCMGPGGRFKNTYEHLNPRALKISMLYKIISFNVWVRYFVWNFKGYITHTLKNEIRRWKFKSS